VVSQTGVLFRVHDPSKHDFGFTAEVVNLIIRRKTSKASGRWKAP
jgi:hypothetical protein